MADRDSTVAELEQLRDDLRVKAHLAGMDLRDFLARQEVRIEEIRRRIQEAGDELEAHAPAVKASLRSLAEDVKAAFVDARDRLREG